MPNKSRKPSLKSDVFWTRFEKSGSIQAYLRFRQARQGEVENQASVKSAKRNTAKGVAKAR